MLMVIGLNPSTADETEDDPTVRRCIGYARDWGYSGLRMMNVFAFRATDPRDMLKAKDPVGPENNRLILKEARITTQYGERGAILAAWGNHGSHRDAAKSLTLMLSFQGIAYACLGATKSGQPKHPLYLAKDVRPIAFERDGGRLVTHFTPIRSEVLLP
jgi:hypothetical protein